MKSSDIHLQLHRKHLRYQSLQYVAKLHGDRICCKISQFEIRATFHGDNGLTIYKVSPTNVPFMRRSRLSTRRVCITLCIIIYSCPRKYFHSEIFTKLRLSSRISNRIFSIYLKQLHAGSFKFRKQALWITRPLSNKRIDVHPWIKFLDVSHVISPCYFHRNGSC